MSDDTLLNEGIDYEALLAAERAEKYRRQLERPEVFPSAENWDYITENAMYILADVLMRKFVVSWMTPESQRSDYHDVALERFAEYLRVIPRECAVDAVYADIHTAPEAVLYLVHEARLFDARALLALLENAENAPFVCDCLDAFQPRYMPADLQAMQRLHRALLDLPDTGEIRESRSIFGREMRYVCANGHSNPADCQFCRTCQIDISGLTPDNVNNISRLETRIRLLPDLLRRAGQQPLRSL